MSMLSIQIAKLRKTAESIDWEIPEAAELLREAADTIEDLRDRLQNQAFALGMQEALGSGTCEDLGGIGANGKEVFHCSKCGCILSLSDSDGMNTLCTSFICDYPRFCPECGRKVVSV